MWTEIPAGQTVDKQDGEDVAPFDRTTDIEVDEEGYVPMERIAEYKFKEVYQLSPDTDKKVRESSSRVMKLCKASPGETECACCLFFVGQRLSVLHGGDLPL